MTGADLQDRLPRTIGEWVEEYGEGPNLAVPADVVLGATAHTLGDLLLAIEDEAVRRYLALSTHTYLDLCLAGAPPPSFGASATIVRLRPRC